MYFYNPAADVQSVEAQEPPKQTKSLEGNGVEKEKEKEKERDANPVPIKNGSHGGRHASPPNEDNSMEIQRNGNYGEFGNKSDEIFACLWIIGHLEFELRINSLRSYRNDTEWRHGHRSESEDGQGQVAVEGGGKVALESFQEWILAVNCCRVEHLVGTGNRWILYGEFMANREISQSEEECEEKDSKLVNFIGKSCFVL